ncbi:GST_C_6 domain-containing protein [Caenorhabditis elegans]|uniref:GST_C_6 domain-containing protein n=1 Tax=Caenorhabditis elegans TaxID=6239 RepID=Q8MQC1_CAEEL|nr:GST_C_6 domain-containing protein [Caenorhabditis elegans]CCD65046.1 GST_C_6 domain-containing protein [Caenorhabditis elegans]|eukprot:NP_001254102.1 Uncharacterized protein CELE_C25H3.7 [Caenorhabditis elegans]
MQSVLNLGKTTVTTCTFLRAASTSLQGKGPLKTNWKENVVYLYQFPRPANRQPNLSPYCLKIETFLRANRIKHEVVGTWLTLRQSPRGLLPFIELNGQQISDSQVIVWKLQKHFDLDDKLEGSDRGTARAVERMIDLSTNYALLVDKTVNNAHLLLARQVSNLPLPSFLTNYLAKGFSQTARKRVNGVLGKLDVAEQKELLRRDIRAIDDILGDKKFLFGDRITSVDCSVFGQIGAVFYLPYRQQISDLLEDDFPRVRAYCDRIRQHYYPEWRDD